MIKTVSSLIAVCLLVHVHSLAPAPLDPAGANIEKFITTFIARLPGIFSFIERFADLPVGDPIIDVLNAKYDDGKFKIGEESISKFTAHSGGVGGILKTVINLFGGKIPGLKSIIESVKQPDGKTKGFISQGLKFVHESSNFTFFDLFAAVTKIPHLEKFGEGYHTIISLSPLVKSLNDEAMSTNVQFRVLLAVLLGQRPALQDLLQLKDEMVNWDEIKAIFINNKQLQKLFSISFNKKPNVAEVIQILTGKTILLNGKLSTHQQVNKYAVTSTDDKDHNAELKFASYAVFVLSNFDRLMNVIKEVSKKSPNIFSLMANGFLMDTSPLKLAKKPETQMVMDGIKAVLNKNV